MSDIMRCESDQLGSDKTLSNIENQLDNYIIATSKSIEK